MVADTVVMERGNMFLGGEGRSTGKKGGKIEFHNVL